MSGQERSPAADGLVARLGRRRDGFTLDLELAVEPGETLALLGPNGAGKSTTVELLAGLLALDSGRIELGGRILDDPAADVLIPAEHRRIGVVFQDHLLFDHLSVLDNVAFGPRSRGAGRRASREAARPVLAAMELDELADRRPAELSGGQAQRVALARALASGPDLLLLDEPMAAVDVSTRSRLRRQLADHLRAFDGPRLLITHDPAEAFALADRLAVIEDGRLVQAGTVDELRRHPRTAWVAALTGTNRVIGTATGDGIVDLDPHLHPAPVALSTASDHRGPVQAVIDPRAVSLHLDRPEGSPRNTWRTTVEWLEPLGRTTRVRLGEPLPLLVDITPTSAEALGLAPGSPVWAAVKATEIAVHPR